MRFHRAGYFTVRGGGLSNIFTPVTTGVKTAIKKQDLIDNPAPVLKSNTRKRRRHHQHDAKLAGLDMQEVVPPRKKKKRVGKKQKRTQFKLGKTNFAGRKRRTTKRRLTTRKKHKKKSTKNILNILNSWI